MKWWLGVSLLVAVVVAIVISIIIAIAVLWLIVRVVGVVGLVVCGLLSGTTARRWPGLVVVLA